MTVPGWLFSFALVIASGPLLRPFPTTSITYIDVYSAAVDQSAFIEFEIDTNCKCPDTVFYEILVVNLEDESYEYYTSKRMIVNTNIRLNIELSPFISLDDYRAVSIYVRSEDSIDNIISSKTFELHAVPPIELEGKLNQNMESPVPSKTRYQESTKIEYYDHFKLQSTAATNSPVIEVSKWSFSILSTIVERPLMEAKLMINSIGLAFPMGLDVDGEKYLFILASSYDWMTKELRPNFLGVSLDLLLNNSYFDNDPLMYDLEIIIHSRLEYQIFVSVTQEVTAPLLGACDTAYWCLHESMSLPNNVVPYASKYYGSHDD